MARDSQSNRASPVRKKGATKRARTDESLPRDARGKLLPTVGALGLLAGGKAHDVQTGFAVRVSLPVVPLMSAEGVKAALRSLETGGDVQAAAAMLHHRDASSVRALIRSWHEYWRFPVPPSMVGDNATLSASALARLALTTAAPLPVPLVVESVGTDPNGRDRKSACRERVSY